MGILGQPQGIFDLNNSDKTVGSFLLKHDICHLLNVSEEDIDFLPFKKINGCDVLDERILQRAWYEGKIKNAPPTKAGNSRISLDEYILKSLIKLTYPEATIEHQYEWGKKRIDFKVSFKGESKFIEFLGPGHFVFMRRPPINPFERKTEIEEHFGIECILWPYWIQRCTRNLRAIFEENVSGLGVLWSTNIHFGDFFYDNSAEMIETINERFNAECDGGYGYFYGPNTCGRNNPEHPIIERILLGKESVIRLLPKGFLDKGRWLPEKLKNVT